MSRLFLTNVTPAELDKRACAIKCVHLQGNDGNTPSQAAVTLFSESYPQQVRADKFVARWWKNFRENHALLAPASGGRSQKVSPSAAKAASTAFKKGFNPRRRTAKYTSIESALRTNAKMKKIQKESGNVSPRVLLAAMLRFDPDLVKKAIRLRPRLEPQHLAERLAHCKKMKRHPKSYFQRLFFADAKKFYIVGPGGSVWCSAKEGDIIVECDGYSGKQICLFYYAVISWWGPVELVFVSGTTLSRKAGNAKKKVSVTNLGGEG